MGQYTDTLETSAFWFAFHPSEALCQPKVDGDLA